VIRLTTDNFTPSSASSRDPLGIGPAEIEIYCSVELRRKDQRKRS
jgi:hypothetical protein